jgi:hypothetical protein
MLDELCRELSKRERELLQKEHELVEAKIIAMDAERKVYMLNNECMALYRRVSELREAAEGGCEGQYSKFADKGISWTEAA